MVNKAHQAHQAQQANLTSMLSSRTLPPPWDPLQARAAVLLSPARAAIFLPLQARAAVLLRPLRARVPLQWPWIR